MFIRRVTTATLAVAVIALVCTSSASAEAPALPGPVQVSPGGGNLVQATWGGVPGAARYHVHASTDPFFVPADASDLGTCAASCANPVDTPGTYYVRVVAENAAGERSAPSAAASTTISFDPASVPAFAIASPAADGDTVSGTVPVTATGTDPSGFTNTRVWIDGKLVAQFTNTLPQTYSWDSATAANGEHAIVVRATNGSGHARVLTRRVTVDNARAASLLAAYGLNDAAGTAAEDRSGRLKTGTVNGATWTDQGRYGGALQFDGVNDSVGLPDLGSFAKTAFTLEAWVRKDGAKKDVAVVGAWRDSLDGGPMVWVDWSTGRYVQTLGLGASTYLDSGHNPAQGTWQHVAATFDGERVRFYLDGAEVAQRTYLGAVGVNAAWRIGAYGNSPGFFFDGAIDEVRIYKRALTAGEVQGDRDTPVGGGTMANPPGPVSISGTGSASWARLDWAATPRAARYTVYRGTTAGFTPAAANRIGQTSGATTYLDQGLAPGTYRYVVVAENDAGAAPKSNEVAVAVGGDVSPPSVNLLQPADGARVTGTIDIRVSASDDIAVTGIQFRIDGQPFGDETTATTKTWDTTAVENGPHTISVAARDAAGHETTKSVTVTVSNVAPAPGAGLLASYTFDDGTARDASPNGRDGTVVGARRVAGRRGDALEFDGIDDHVDLPPLGVFYGGKFTLSAWVNKSGATKDTGVVGAWTDAGHGGPMIWVDHLDGRYRLTMGDTFLRYLDSGQRPATGEWHHLTATSDRITARFYVDGVETASGPAIDPVGTSNVWRIGAYGATASHFFDGLVDEVKVYNRALTRAEVQAAINEDPGDPTPPAAPADFATENVGPYSITVGWTPVPDDGGLPVTRYFLYRDGVKTGEATTPRFAFGDLVCDRTYQLGIEARDQVGRASPRVTLPAATAACPPAGDSLVAAYAFDEASGATTADASGHLRGGTLVGASFTPGRNGTNALRVDGAGRVDLPQLGTFYRQGFSLEAWIRKDYGSRADAGIVGSWSEAAGGGTMLWVDHVSGRNRLTLGSRFADYLDSGVQPPEGGWQHVAATYDGTTARYYIDGTEVASRTVTADLGTSDVWRIGAYGPAPGGYFTGTIDDVRIYSRARTGEEVRSDRLTPITP